MIRLILRITAVIVVLVLVAMVVVWTHLDRVAAAALVTGVENTGEVPCEVDRVSLSLLRGRIEIDNLVVSNPPKFAEADMFTVASATLDLRIGSLVNRPIHIEELEIIEPMVRLEPGWGGSNVKVFLDNVQRNTAPAAPDQKEAEPAEEPVRLYVDRLLIKDATVQIGSGFGRPALAVKLQTIELADIRGDDGKGVTAGELTAMILMQLVREGAIQADLNVGDLIPAALSERFDKGATVISDLGKAAARRAAEEGAKQAGKDAGSRALEAVKSPFGADPDEPEAE